MSFVSVLLSKKGSEPTIFDLPGTFPDAYGFDRHPILSIIRINAIFDYSGTVPDVYGPVPSPRLPIPGSRPYLTFIIPFQVLYCMG